MASQPFAPGTVPPSEIQKSTSVDTDSPVPQSKPEHSSASLDIVSESDVSMQHGVEVAEALRKAWTKKPLYIAYASLFFSALITSFASYASSTYTAYATSAFKAHSMLTTAAVVYKIARVVAYPIMAKLADVFGRAEGFTFAILLTTLSYIVYAASNNISTYVAGYFFDALGDVGYTIMQQIFIADTTSLINRGLWASLPEAVTSIPTLYLGSIVAESMLENSTWRWGYGMWAIILPICTAPLIFIMFWLHKKAKAQGEIKTIAVLKNLNKEDPWYKKTFQLLWVELDVLGAFLLAAGLTMTLIPINIAGKANLNRWKQAHNIVLLILGILTFGAFLVWDSVYAKKPFIPYKMVRKFTIFAACAMGFLDFMNYACFTSFLPSYLQVAGHYSPGVSTRIDNSLRVSFQIASVLVGILMKYTKRAKIYCYIGVPMVILGQGLMIYLVNMKDNKVANQASLVVAKVIFGIGRGFYQTASQVLVQAVVRKQEVAVATALFLATMSIGAAIGTTIGGAIWNNKLPAKLAKYLPAANQKSASAIFKSIVVAQKFAVGTPARIAIDRAYRETMQTLAIVSTCVIIPMLVLMFFLTDVHLDDAVDREAEEHEENMTTLEEQSSEKTNSKSNSLDHVCEKQAHLTLTETLSK